MNQAPPYLVLFDGVCALCDGSVRFLLRADRRGRLRFATLQGTAAAQVRARHEDFAREMTSVVLVEDFGAPGERIHLRSDATLRILAGLGGAWRMAVVLRVVPRGLRDAVYDWVARHRYRWFGRRESCRVPAEGERSRFLE